MGAGFQFYSEIERVEKSVRGAQNRGSKFSLCFNLHIKLNGASSDRALTPNTLQPSRMPKKANTKKAASAQYQNIKALAEAAMGAEGMTYLTVEKAMGNRYFLCLTSDGHQVMAEPRKLFTRGSMRVEAGGIVVAVTPAMPEWKKQMLAEQRAEHMAAAKRAKQHGGAAPVANLGLPYEIVGVITERSEAKRLIRAKMMPQSILDQAVAVDAGPAAEAALLAEDIEFMTPEEAAKQSKQERLAAMTPEERAEYATKLQMEKKLAALTPEGAPEHAGKDGDHHASRGMKQARMAADSRSSIQQRLTALLNGAKKVADLRFVASAAADDDEEESPAAPRKKKSAAPKAPRPAPIPEEVNYATTAPEVDAEALFAAKVAALRAELAAIPEVDDWETAADAEVSLEDL